MKKTETICSPSSVYPQIQNIESIFCSWMALALQEIYQVTSLKSWIATAEG
jgi:hypothetical protein